MSTHDQPAPASDSATSARSEARQADYVAFLHRVLFAIDALNMGFLPGFREDCSYQQQQITDLTCPVGMLDNDFRDPDLDRYVDRIFEQDLREARAWFRRERRELDAAIQEVEQELIWVKQSEQQVQDIVDRLS